MGLKSTDAFGVFTSFSVDANNITRTDEQWSINNRACFKGDLFIATFCGVTFNCRGRFSDFEVYLDWNIDADDFFIKDNRFDDAVWNDEAEFITGDILTQRESF